MDKNSIVVSYLVRCTEAADGSFRVYVHQVQSGEESYFATFDEALAFMKEEWKMVRQQ